MRRWVLVLLCAAGGGIAALYLLVSPQSVDLEAARPVNRPARLLPEYAGSTIPPNIAPLNFLVQEPGRRYCVRIRSARGAPIQILAATEAIIIPVDPWRELLRLNAGGEIQLDVYAERERNRWSRFDTVTVAVAKEAIDRYLVYRLLKPLYNRYLNLGIYERDLESYAESVVVHNRSFDHGCLNCHTFLANSPERMALHIRTKAHGKPMLVVRDGEILTVTKPGGYMTWHPSGRLIAFSINQPSLLFHTVGETRDVFDASSDLLVYMIDTNRRVTPGGIARPDRLETWPAWAPDGKHLYFSSAPKLPAERFRDVKYSLMRVSFDLERDAWGEPETVLSADDTGLSITQPRISPDGRFLLFCMSEYGNFPVYLKSADLYLMDLETRAYKPLAVNSDEADSWHAWSSNGRWIVFSSKRRDGLFARPYLSYVDENGTAHTPILLPQEDPGFYDSFTRTYNVPELIKEPIRVGESDFTRAILDPLRPLAPKAEAQEKEPTHEDEVAPADS